MSSECTGIRIEANVGGQSRNPCGSRQLVKSKGRMSRMIVGKHTESRAAIVLRRSIQACIHRRFDGIDGCGWGKKVI